jgi:hypothetical protein
VDRKIIQGCEIAVAFGEVLGFNDCFAHSWLLIGCMQAK